MAESYSVKAVLSAVDKNFTSTFKGCLGTLNSINSKISGMAFGFLSGAGTAAFNAITGSVSGLISEMNDSNASWKTFEKNMAIVEKSGGKLEKSVSDVKAELQEFAEKTVYSSADMASTYAQLAAVGTKNTALLVKGFGGLAAAAENPQQAMKTLSQQATQMAAKPTVAWADFKLMLEQTPAGIAAVAREMGMSTAQMVTAVQNGTVKTEKFFDAIAKVGGDASGEFYKMATEAKTVGQAMDGLKETVSNKLTPAFDMFSKLGIKAVNGIADKLSSINVDKISNKICIGMVRASSYIKKAGKYIDVFKTSFSGVGKTFSGAFNSMKSVLSGLFAEFGSTESLDLFKSAVDRVAGVLQSVFGFIQANSGTIKDALSTGFSIAKSVWESFSGAASKVKGAVVDLIGYVVANSDVFMSILSAGVQAAKPYWDAFVNALVWAIGIFKKVATVIVENEDTVKRLIPWLLGAVAAFKGFNVVKSVLPFITNFAGRLGTMAKSLAGGLAGKLFGVSNAQKGLGEASAASGTSVLKTATALLLMGAAVLLVATGFALLTQSAIALANSGGLAIGILAGMIVVIALMAVGAAALAPALTAGAVGLIAFGAALALCGVAAVLAAASLAIITNCLPGLCEYGLQGSVAILAIGSAMIVFAAGAALAGAGIIVLAAGLVVLAAGLVAASLAVVVLSAGILVFGVAMAAGAAGTLLMAAALKSVAKHMKTIAQKALETETSLNSMRESVKLVESGLDALGRKVKSAMDKVVSAFEQMENKAKSAGKAAGNGFTGGMQSGLNKAPAVAASAVSLVATTLNSGASAAYSAGQNISAGFAAGMQSCLGQIQSAAAAMAAAADAAIRAKAKIHSPSEVTTALGKYFGEGFVNGIATMAKDAWKVAQELVSIPQVATPQLAGMYGYELSSDYDYSDHAEYNITVVSELDGREIARGTVPFMEDEMNKRQTRTNRKKGTI
ncbi:MAG: tape measure protein [Bacteroidaceae bacterium]|nr:tape measure protein [Bacteroidaceae bacterium]